MACGIAQAAIRAGYSKKTAEQTASRLLSFVKVKEAIAEAMENREKRTEITQDKVLRELAKIGFANMADYMRNWDCCALWITLCTLGVIILALIAFLLSNSRTLWKAHQTCGVGYWHVSYPQPPLAESTHNGCYVK